MENTELTLTTADDGYRFAANFLSGNLLTDEECEKLFGHADRKQILIQYTFSDMSSLIKMYLETLKTTLVFEFTGHMKPEDCAKCPFCNKEFDGYYDDNPCILKERFSVKVNTCPLTEKKSSLADGFPEEGEEI